QQSTDAIVNAANSSLLGGGGVDGAIHRAGGPRILKECRKVGPCPTGKARITTGGDLAARYVIHAVGPRFSGNLDQDAALLASAYRSSLELATQHNLRSLAFPSISTGVFAYPLDQAAHTALETTIAYLRDHAGIELVRFVLFDARTFAAYQQALDQLIGGAPSHA
ncbi:MAG: O-acetyl-ADP-ribose deacetylase, partial [Chloroflexales bacterium]|nr:O-acetyl-ADP-ribose deacetylase [Chloroflexales bacterium]